MHWTEWLVIGAMAVLFLGLGFMFLVMIFGGKMTLDEIFNEVKAYDHNHFVDNGWVKGMDIDQAKQAIREAIERAYQNTQTPTEFYSNLLKELDLEPEQDEDE